MKETSRLEKEQQWLPISSALIATVTGFYTLWTAHNSLQQIIILLHVIAGVTLSMVIIPYQIHHILRTIGVRKVAIMLSGVMALTVLISLVLSGLWIIGYGQTEISLVSPIHEGMAYLLVIICAVHIGSYAIKNKTAYFPSISVKKNYFQSLLLALLIVLLTQQWISINTPDLSPQPQANYEYPYGPHPFRPSQTETENNQFIADYQIAYSEDCASCHTNIAEQWQSSMHRQAASDPTYVANINLLAEKKGIAATRYCEGCHAPIALLTGQLSKGGQHGGEAETLAFHQGVSCLSCHSIKHAVHDQGVASYYYQPKQDYLFSGWSQPWAQSIRHFLIQIQPRQHRKDMNRPVLQKVDSCYVCHSQFIDKSVNEWGWLPLQDEYRAWLKSPYSGQIHDHQNQQKKRCQDCHMPLITARDPSANKEGQVRSHYSLGANTAIPYLYGDKAQLQRTREYLQSHKMRVTIEPPKNNQATINQNYLKTIQRSQEPPSYAYLGEQVQLNILVTNQGVGHDFPGGTIDINQAWLAYTINDAEQRLIKENGQLDEDNKVDEKAHFYESIAIDRHGKKVWRHDLFNQVGEVGRNIIKAGDTDPVAVQFRVPYWAKSPITIKAVLRYRKFNQAYATWALKQKVNLPIVDMAYDILSLPLRNRDEID